MADEPKPLVFPKVGGVEPRPLDFSKVTTDWIRPERPPPMAEPKGLQFGAAPPPATKRDLADHAAPGALNLPTTPAPAPPPRAEPGALRMPTQPAPPPPLARPEPGALRMPTERVEMIEVHQIGQPVRHVPLNPPPTPRAPLTDRIIGGDPRAPAMVEAARQINPTLANHRLFRGRLELFLDLRPSAWATWGEKDLRVLIDAASKQANFARQLSLANTIKWAGECEQAYKKPPGLLDALAPKPEYYRTRIEQARDILIKIADEIDTLNADLGERFERIGLDTLVIQVATATVTDQSDRITADMRYQGMVGAMQTATMIVQGLESLGQTIAHQKGLVGDLLNITIPNWIMARSRA